MLSITYKNGETRVITLHPSFHVESAAGLLQYKISKADANVSLSKRCISIAIGFNGHPHKVVCLKNGIESFSKTWLENTPADVSSPKKVTDEEKLEKKELRREFKNNKFTQKWDFTTGMFTNLLTGEKMFSDKIAA